MAPVGAEWVVSGYFSIRPGPVLGICVMLVRGADVVS